MTLRTRLTLFFVAIVVPPLLAATIAFQVLASRQAEARTESTLAAGSRAVVTVWEDQLRLVQRDVTLAAERLGPRVDEPRLPRAVEAARLGAGLDMLVLAETGGAVRASSTGPHELAPPAQPPVPDALLVDPPPPTVVPARIEVMALDRSLTMAGGRYADAELARVLARATGIGVAIVGDGVTYGSIPVPEGGEELRSDRVLVAPSVYVVLQAPVPEAFPSWLWLIVAAGLVTTVVIGLMLAGVMARPLERLAEGARAVASGRLDTRVEAGDQTDVANVADSFNTMTEYLRTYVGELQLSRDELRRNLDRMGATLRTTLDLEGMLEVMLDTASVTLGARAGAVFLLRGAVPELELHVARGYTPPPGATLAVGAGIAGRAAATGAPLLVEREGAAAQPGEPDHPTAVAVPLVRGDRTIGVIALYGRTSLEPFGQQDAETLSSFGGQASVAIENVLLHQETRQLSITDGLTGVWNRRYLELTLRKEIERAQRFGRPLSTLMIDIDRFKRVNDRLGHQRGDEVLVELTQRLLGELRSSIDVVGRYGGEEFVVVLPETPEEGARVVAEKIRSAIRGEPFTSDGGGEVSVTVSVGVATYPEDGITAETVVRAADQAMYRAKAAGRDRVESHSTG